MGRKKAFPWRWRIIALGSLLLAGGGIYGWWQAQNWQPSRDEFPAQGVLVGASDGALDFNALAAVGADFAYLEASSGEDTRDPALGENLRLIGATAMPFGAVHTYDPCIPAERQAANFVTIVPRDANMLPPVIALDKLASECADPIVEAGLESELTTFLNQVEGHAGQSAILKLSAAFENHHAIASRIERSLWLEQAYFEPDYAGRPWTLWTANPRLRTGVSDAPLRWVVAQP